MTTRDYGSSITALNTSGQAVGWTEQNGVAGPSPQAKVWTYTISGGAITSQTALNLQSQGGLASARPATPFASAAVAINTSGQAVIAVVDDTNNGGSRSITPPKRRGPGVATLLYNMNTQAYTLLPRPADLRWPRPVRDGNPIRRPRQAINDSGQVVGRMLTSSGGYDAAIWQNGTLTDLNTIYGPSGLNILPAGFTLNNAMAIDNNGDIAGYGTDAAGHTNQAFVIYAPLPGDANLDGKVDINDLTIVLSHYGQSGMTWTEGEFTGDGTVDINDLTIVLAHYNTPPPRPPAAPAAVPEP